MVAGCTSDAADEHSDNGKPRQEHELRLSMGMPRFQDATRAAGDLPEGFTAYAYNEKTPINEIVGFLIPVVESGLGQNTVTCHFHHEESSGSHVWKSRAALQDGSYSFYGYMPNVSATNVSVTKNDDGAVITLTGMNAVMPDDICVIEGVKQYAGSTLPDMTDGIGNFDYNTTSGGDNFYVLASHIYAALQIKMQLDETYAELRKIKLKSITLTPVEGSEAAKRVDATITVSQRTEGTDLSSAVSVKFATSAVATATSPAVLYGVENTYLTTTPQEFLACLCPELPADSKYVMETRYDVFDSKDNLIRENQTAQNVLTLPKLDSGKRHVVNITVTPTYLYVLSDPDLDNPTFSLKVERKDRTVDQMVQSARSGKQNIAEGSAAASTSSETEIKLIGVARASINQKGGKQ